jgi:hypothetical protein
MDNVRILQIKEWLKSLRKAHRCPFRFGPNTGQICIKLFPNIVTDENLYIEDRACGIRYECPCAVYSVEEVVARAEEVIDV